LLRSAFMAAIAWQANLRPSRMSVSRLPVGCTRQKLSGCQVGWSLARSFTNGSALVAGSARGWRSVAAAAGGGGAWRGGSLRGGGGPCCVDSCSVGAEYASRRNGAGREVFDRVLTVMAPSHVTGLVLSGSRRPHEAVLGLGSLVEARTDCVQIKPQDREYVRTA